MAGFAFFWSLKEVTANFHFFFMMLPSKRPAPDHHGHGSGDDDDDQRFGAMVPEPKRRATLKK